MCINKYFHQYIVKVRNSNHWYNVEAIDYMNNCIFILYKNMLVRKSFYDIEKIKVVGVIENWDNKNDSKR